MLGLAGCQKSDSETSPGRRGSQPPPAVAESLDVESLDVESLDVESLDVESLDVEGVPVEVVPGARVSRGFGGRHVLRFSLELGAGPRAVEIAVHQEGSDVTVSVLDGGGRTLLSADRADGPAGRERFVLLAPAAGAYELAAEWLGGDAAGSATVEILDVRAPADDDRLRARADLLFVQGEEARNRRDRESCLEAAEHYRRALAAFEELGERDRQAEVLQRLGWLHRKYLEDHDAAVGHYRRAADLYSELGEQRRLSSVLNNLGRAHFRLGRMEQAVTCWQRALELKRRLGDRSGEASSLSNLGLANRYLGHFQQALVDYDQALDALRAGGPSVELGRAYNNRGRFYDSLGQQGQALADLRRALTVGRQIGQASLQAMSLTAIGRIQLEEGRAPEALSSLQEAVQLRAAAGSRSGRAVTLRALGEVLEALDRLQEAEAAQREALALFEAQQTPRDVARAHASLGGLALVAGRAAEARDHYERAIELFRRLEDLEGEVTALAGRARALRLGGELDAAVRTMERALAGVDRLRLRAATPDLRAAFLARYQDDVGFLVDACMEKHRREPRRGHDRRAFETHEAFRARALFDRITTRPRGGGETSLGAREEAAASHLELLARQHRTLREDATPEQLRTLESRLDEAVRRLRAMRGEIALRQGGGRGRTGGEVLGVAEIRRQLLGDGSTLLAYRLGEERSYLWRLTASTFESRELGPGPALAALARRVHRLLRQSHRRESRGPLARALERLSSRLLGPVVDSLDGRRLLIIADGALLTVPFAALPLPGEPSGETTGPVPLLARHESVFLPSASSVAALRRRSLGRAWRHSVAVIAPPAQEGARQVSRTRGDGAALPFAHREGDTIRRLAGDLHGHDAAVFASTPRTLRDPELASFRVVHLAAHGEIDSERPELSRLVFGPSGVLFADEVAGLDLPAELVVLSACETALGREVRGEGLVGLPQSFLQAGASSVVVSLWRVDDRATAELMGHFYSALLGEGLPAPAALRRAQLALSRRSGWRAPYYWAGFVLLGEWRPAEKRPAEKSPCELSAAEKSPPSDAGAKQGTAGESPCTERIPVDQLARRKR